MDKARTEFGESAVGLPAADRWGWVVPIACAVHCVSGPVLIVAAPAFATSLLLEAGLMAAACLVAIPVVAGGVQAHGRSLVWLPVVLGALIWGVELMGLPAPVPGTALTVVGSLLIASGLLWNARLRAIFQADCSCTAYRAKR